MNNPEFWTKLGKAIIAAGAVDPALADLSGIGDPSLLPSLGANRERWLWRCEWLPSAILAIAWAIPRAISKPSWSIKLTWGGQG